MRIKLSDHFSYKRLLKFTMPPIFMMVFTSIYGVVDGLFVSNFAGKTPFAAINLIMPVLMILGSLGFMIGTGGTAIVSQLLGEGKKEDADRFFSLMIYVTLGGGIVFAALGEATISFIARAMIDGKNLEADVAEIMFDNAVLYGRIILLTIPCYMLQNVFQAFFTTAEKPMLGFVITLAAGCTNILFDGIFVGVAKTGVAGAAIATCMSQVVGAVIPFFYFLRKNNSLLRLCKPKFSGRVLLKTCTNGSSEFVSNISGSLVSMVYNHQLLKLAGENGISAYGVMMYVNFIYVAIFIGYSIGAAPVIGYNYGAKNKSELKNICKKSLTLMGLFGIAMTLFAVVLAAPIAKIFVGYDAELYEMTKNAFYIYSLSFLFTGFSIFSSSMFTALGDGLVSAVISFMRTLVFQIVCAVVLPIFWGLTGVWLSMLFAEILATGVAVVLLVTMRKKYGYFGKDKALP